MPLSDEETLAQLSQAVHDGETVLLHGPGGCGKTFQLRNLASQLVDEGKVVAMTAFTGVAAINLNVPEKKIKSRTLNSWSGIGLGKESAEKLATKVQLDKRARDRWNKTDVLMCDEVSMIGAMLFSKLDYVARKVRNCDEPFGGLQVIYSGDFLQLPPVKDDWVFNCPEWDDTPLRPFSFKEPKRYDDRAWFETLLRIRIGKPSQEDIQLLYSRLAAYEQLMRTLRPTDVRPTTLYSRRIDVTSMNHIEMDKLSSEEVSYESIDMFTAYKRGTKADAYETQIDETISKTIKLKIGAQVMLKANLSVETGLVNGSRGVVVTTGEDFVNVKFVSGRVERIERWRWSNEDDSGAYIRDQIPLILAWSLTIHQVQGATLDYAIIDLGRSVFEDNQAYVALGRVRSIGGVFLSAFVEESIRASTEALRYVAVLEETERMLGNS